jgi:hypothetical protein
MVNPKCVMCNTYISKVELKSSGEPYKTCNRCRGLRKNKYKKISINKADEIDDKKISIDKADEKEDRRKFNTIRNMVEIDNFFDKLGNSIKYKCIECGVKYIRGDDDFDEEGEPYESCSKCFPRTKLNERIERCLEHTFTTKKNECDVCGTLFFVPDSESD